MYGSKIRMVRELRGFSQENVAALLGIAQNTYSKYENNQIKISAEVIQKIADIFEVSLIDLMTREPAIVNFQTTVGINSNVDESMTSQKDFYELLLSYKEAEIERLNKIIDKLLDERK